MVALDYLLLFLMCFLGTIAAVSDINYGIIPNKLVARFAIYGAAIDCVYYGILAKDVAAIFLINVLVTVLISVCLYYTHMFAGGDCKLVSVLSLLYPAGMYMTYGSNSITLFSAIGLAIFFGYLYLLLSAAWRLITGETRINIVYIKSTIVMYFVSYLSALLYVVFINLAYAFIDLRLVKVDSWIVWVSCIMVAWISGRIPIFKNKRIIITMILINIALSVYLKVIPLSLNPMTYMITALLLLCQMMIRTNIYEQIPTLQVRKGMILSTFSSIAMQNSKIKGLPEISAEDLRNRLTDTEAESIRRWGKSPKGLKEITIIKKIPFAVFITMGYIAYFIIWRIVR